MMIASRRLMVVAVVTGLSLGALVGCKAKGKSEPKRPAPMAETERKRAADACTAYLTKLCACAEAKPDQPDLKKRCDLDKALPEAYQLTLSVDDDPTAPLGDVIRAQDQARKIVASCIQNTAQLATSGCP
jgi:hypothetical protein